MDKPLRLPEERFDMSAQTPDAATETLNETPLSKRRLKMWIRVLNMTRRVEAELRDYLRVEHNTTLPRFDVMAALYRRREKVTMSELSRMLLVSNGNATAVVDRLEKDGMAQRNPAPGDRRTIHVTLTPAGLAAFESMASGHETRLNAMLDGLNSDDLDMMREMMRRIEPENEK